MKVYLCDVNGFYCQCSEDFVLIQCMSIFLTFKKIEFIKKKLELFLNQKKFSTCVWQEKSCHKQEQNKKTFSHSFSEKELSTN